MFMGAVYLFPSDKGNHLKHNILQLYMAIIFLAMGDPYLVKIQKHELKELKNGRKEQYLKN